MATGYTTLRVTEAGVVLLAWHRARFAPAAWPAFDDFSRAAAPGVYALLARGAALEIEARPGSRLVDGVPTRVLVSPVAGRSGPLDKQPPGSAWDAVRQRGVATLLTDPSGQELYEACVAAVLGWNGRALVAPPADRPRVASTAAAALLAIEPWVEQPLPVAGGPPLLLVNAVALTCVPAGSAFPADVRARLHAALLATAGRP
jgi:hypothetical protein